jgi:hypothetical protein
MRSSAFNSNWSYQDRLDHSTDDRYVQRMMKERNRSYSILRTSLNKCLLACGIYGPIRDAVWVGPIGVRIIDPILGHPPITMYTSYLSIEDSGLLAVDNAFVQSNFTFRHT